MPTEFIFKAAAGYLLIRTTAVLMHQSASCTKQHMIPRFNLKGVKITPPQASEPTRGGGTIYCCFAGSFKPLHLLPFKTADISICSAELKTDQPDLIPLSLIFLRIFFPLDLLKSTTWFGQFIDLEFKNIDPLLKTNRQVDAPMIGDIFWLHIQPQGGKIAVHDRTIIVLIADKLIFSVPVT